MNKNEILNDGSLTKLEHGAVQNNLISNGFDSKSQVGVVSMKKDEILKQVKRRKGRREYGVVSIYLD